MGRRCHEVLDGRDVFGNRFCYPGCPVRATLREEGNVRSFDLNVSAARARLDAHVSVRRIPSAGEELAIIRLKVPDASEQLARQVVSAVQKIRALELRKAPSISESLDWARALVLLNADRLDAALVESTLTLVVKHERDLERVKANLDKVLADS